MPIEVYMPALSPTMEDGTLSNWLVKVGDEISSGDIICEIETDKATMEVETIDEGIIGQLYVKSGTENIKVGALIAAILEEGEDKSSLKSLEQIEQGKATQPAEVSQTVEPLKPATIENLDVLKTDTRIKVSPLARRLADQEGLNLSDIQGSGPNGRIIKLDIEGVQNAKQKESPEQEVPHPTELEPYTGEAPFVEEKLSSMRKTIARRLTNSKQTVPHFYLTVDAEMDKLLSLRSEVNLQMKDKKLSINDFIIKASAMALKKVPDANVQFGGEVLRRFSRSDISVAVAIDGGLVTPVIRAAETLGLEAISYEMKRLTGLAKEGKLNPKDYSGGSFSISNLGMYGIRDFSAVINPPQGAILAVGSGEKRAIVKNNALSIATIMTMTLSCDHRAIDGSIGATFLQAIKEYLENPLLMLI
ncbi:MAG: pyruvate dehydrogenase complex dihydrolipoamide acetyltransferase [Sphingomonadales bacterium]